jgi:hypothetical protein
MFSFTTAQHVYCTNTVETVQSETELYLDYIHRSCCHMFSCTTAHHIYCTDTVQNVVCTWNVLTVITQKHLLHIQLHKSTETIKLLLDIENLYIGNHIQNLDPSKKVSWPLTHFDNLTALLNTRLCSRQGRFTLYVTFPFRRGTSPFSNIFSRVIKRRCSHWQEGVRHVSDPFRRRRRARMFYVTERVRTGLNLLDSDNVNRNYINFATRRKFACNKGFLFVLKNGWKVNSIGA